jgi:hypothetical protein
MENHLEASFWLRKNTGRIEGHDELTTVLLSDREGRRWHETHWHSDGLL